MRTVAFLNRKGGVGKTSCVHHLAGTLSLTGKQVLLVDTDPQASLTQGLLGPEVAWSLPEGETLAALYHEAGGAPLPSLIRSTPVPGVWLVPGSERMDHYNVPDPWLTGEDQFVLRDALGEVKGDFDLALLDGPPHVQLCAWSALAAADGIVVPLQPEDYGAQGVAAIQDSIDRVRAVANPSLALLGFLVTMYNKALSVHVTYETNLRAVYGSDVFDAVVPLAKDFKEAVTVRKPVAQFKPRSAASKAVSALAEELLRRLDERVPSAGAGRRVA